MVCIVFVCCERAGLVSEYRAAHNDVVGCFLLGSAEAAQVVVVSIDFVGPVAQARMVATPQPAHCNLVATCELTFATAPVEFPVGAVYLSESLVVYRFFFDVAHDGGLRCLEWNFDAILLLTTSSCSGYVSDFIAWYSTVAGYPDYMQLCVLLV